MVNLFPLITPNNNTINHIHRFTDLIFVAIEVYTNVIAIHGGDALFTLSNN